MSCRIIVDSCGELPEKLKKDDRFLTVPLSLLVDDETIMDDETFDQIEFLRKVAQSPNCPKSACPSPEQYKELYEGEAEHVYVVTLSSKLSGSYNSAHVGQQLYVEEGGTNEVYVFDSRSASVGETLIAMKTAELEEAGCSFSEVVAQVERYIEQMQTFFVLETLETLRKNGRLSNLKALVANVLNIKPVMGANQDGTICQLDQARGIQKALTKMVKQIAGCVQKGRVLAISHCNCPQRAESVKQMLMETGLFQDIFILDTAGISSLYASDGGIIVAV